MKKIDFLHTLRAFGNADVSVENYAAKVKAPGGGGFCSSVFSSLEDRVTMRLVGQTNMGKIDIKFCLCAIDENGNVNVVFEENIIEDRDRAFDYTYSFDPIKLGVYNNAVSFFVKVYSMAQLDYRIKDFYAIEGEAEQANASFEVVCNIRESEDGTKTVAVKQNDGTILSVPLVPKKVVFVGNSILLGMFNLYGMCATDDHHDYAYYVRQAITAHNPDCSFKKLHGAAFERAETKEGAENWMENDNGHSKKPSKDSFDADTDLVLIQLGDNVSAESDENIEVFKHNLDRLIIMIKDMCPKARIVWVFGWYNKLNTCDVLFEMALKHQVELVDISSVRSKENESFLEQTCINAEGEEIAIKPVWVTHPGNAGMRAIADKILHTLQL